MVSTIVLIYKVTDSFFLPSVTQLDHVALNRPIEFCTKLSIGIVGYYFLKYICCGTTVLPANVTVTSCFVSIVIRYTSTKRFEA